MAKLRPEVAERYSLVGEVGEYCHVAGLGRIGISAMSLRVADRLFASGVKFLKKRPAKRRKKAEIG